MVDAKAGVAHERVSEMVPERVDALVWMQMAKRVRPALVDKLPIGLPDLDPEEGVVRPAFQSLHTRRSMRQIVRLAAER